MTPEDPPTQLLHASCVALSGRAVLILGPSGAGKSTMALQLMAFGCQLVSDDQTLITRKGDALWAEAPDAIRGRIEARGLGLLAADTAHFARIVLLVDLGQVETARLPPQKLQHICGLEVPLVHKVDGGHFPAAILQYLKADRIA